MNYLDFSRKIMLYLQLRGILFEFDIEGVSGDLTLDISNKNGLPFTVAVSEKNSIDISAINGDGILARIDDITAKGETRFEFIAATAALAEIEHIEEKARVIAELVVGEAISAALAISEKSSMAVVFEPLNALALSFDIESNDANIALLIEHANAVLFETAINGKATADYAFILATAAVLSIAVTSAGRIAIQAITANSAAATVNIAAKNSISMTIQLLVSATIADYSGYKLEDMGGSTLAELSIKTI